MKMQMIFTQPVLYGHPRLRWVGRRSLQVKLQNKNLITWVCFFDCL